MKSFLSLFLALCAFSHPLMAQELVVKERHNPHGMPFLMSNVEKMSLELQSVRSMVDGQFLLIQGDLETIQANPWVEYAEPNYRYHTFGEIDQTAIEPKAWGLKAIGVQRAWLKAKGDGVVVAVIDSGVDSTHPALQAKMLKGYNFIKKSDDTSDDAGHGTHVAGIVVGDNVGVAPNAKVLPVKFIDADGYGTLADAIEAVHYANQQHVAIESNSWGGGNYSQALYDVIKEGGDAGIWFIAASGNDFSDNDKKPSYPASYDLPNVISVAATDEAKKLAYFSNFGKTKVHVAAPGASIYSSVPKGEYKMLSGTSMATPHVSGVAALMVSYKLDPKEIKERLMKSCDKRGYPVVCQGQISAWKALR